MSLGSSSGGTGAAASFLSVVQQGRSFSGRERHCCFLNTGEAQFADVSAISGLDVPDDGRGLATTDWDNDGDLDVWISNRNGPMLRYFENSRSNLPVANYLRLRLIGTASNRDAIGTRAELFLKGQDRPIVRSLNAGEGFLSQSSKWMHFGCGDSNAVEKLTVRWPNGQVDAHYNLQLNSSYQLTEGNAQPKELRATMTKPPESKNSTEYKTSQRSQLFSHMPIPVPRLRYESELGKQVDLTEHRGKPVLVSLWASWCPNCKNEISSFRERKEDISKSGLSIVVLSVDRLLGPTKGAPEQQALLADGGFVSGWATDRLVDHIQMLHDTIYDLYEPVPVPTSLLLDSEGNMAAFYKGPVTVDRLLDDVRKTRLAGSGRRDESLPFRGRWIANYKKLHLIDLVFRLLDAGYGEDALEFYTRHARMLSAHTQSPRLFLELGNVLLATGHEHKACEFFHASRKAAPKYYQPVSRLAWVLATSEDDSIRNADESLKFAKLAGQLSRHRDPLVLDTLAAAFAATGDFRNAVQASLSAAQLARVRGKNELAEEIKSRTPLYQNGKQFRRSGK